MGIWKKAVGALAALPVLVAGLALGAGTAVAQEPTAPAPAAAPAANVAPAATDGSNGYLWLHFEATDYEKIYYGYSADGVTWNKLNDNQPLITSDVANKGIRDPHIIRLQEPDADGNKYVMIGTDLHAEGSAGGKSWSQKSQNVIISRSKDLVTWTKAEAVFAGWDDANRVWAPEAIWDSAKNAYLVYWSSKPDSAQSTPLGVYKTYTTDFKTFTTPERWIDESSVNNANIIDTTIVKGDDGDYYRFSTSDWNTVVDTSPTLDAEHWTRLVDRDSAVNADGTSKIPEYQKANNPAQGDQKIITTTAAGLGGIEGLTVFQLPGGTWRIMGDNQGYRAFDIAKLSDLKAGKAPTKGTSNFPQRFRHGTVMALTADEQKAVLDAYGPQTVDPVEPDKNGSAPIATYDFEDANDPGKDTTGNGNTMTLHNGAKAEYYGDLKSDSLSLRGGTQYAELPTGLFDGRDEFTLEFSSKSRATSGAFFSFAIGQDQNKYLFLRLRGNEAYAAITENGWQNEQKISGAIDTQVWNNYTLVVKANHIALYGGAADGNQSLLGQVDTTVSISDLGANLKAYFGKSFYASDGTYNGGIDDVNIYNYAKSPLEVQGPAAALTVKDTDQILSQNATEDAATGAVTKSVVLDYWADPKTGAKSDKSNVKFEYEIPEGVTVADENGKALTVADLNAKTDYTTPLKLKLTYDGKTVDYTVGVEVLVTPVRISGDEAAKSGIGEKDPTGNEGWKFFADPQVVAYGGKYYIFPTTDGYSGWAGHSIHVFESSDMVNWEDKGTVVDLSKDYNDMIDGRKEKAWAPGFAIRNNKFYLYFSGNGMTNVAISDPEQGGTITSGYKIQKVKVESSIDPAVFQDPNTGKWYLAWGQSPGKYAELTDDMTGIKAGTTVTTNATRNMREGSYITSRPDPNVPGNTIYYYSYSIDDTNSPNYSVGYAYVSAKKLSDVKGTDWQYGGVVLHKDDAKGILGTAHHSFVQVPNTDDWYVVYHAFLTDEMRPRGYDSTHDNKQIANGNKREVRIARVTYDKDGKINAIPVTYEGVLPETTPATTVSGVAADGARNAVGDKLTVAYNEGWKLASVQWYRADDASGKNESAIEGATSAEYTLTAADAGKVVYAKTVGENTTGVLQNAQPGTAGAKASRTFEMTSAKATVAPLSADASLKSLTVAGVSVDVEKAASEAGASVEVDDPAKVGEADVEAEAADKASAKVEVKDSVVTVTVTAEDGTTQKVYKVALVKKAVPDTAAPVFAGVDDVTVEFGASFDPLAGVSAKDDVDGDLTGSIKVEGSVDTSKAGEYTLTYSVTDAAGNAATATRKVTVKAKAEPKPALKFTDVTAATPHAGDIQWLADQGISTGWATGENTAVFSPMGPVVRQDMAAFLYRLAGSPDYTPSAEDKARFTDVDESTPHYKEVLWLASTGIAEGFRQADGSFQFGGNRAVVRQDMAAFLKRLADYQKADPSLGEGVAFTDVDARTPHADDIAWLAKAGVAGGFGDGTFGGMRLVVRQDMAAFLHRMDTNVLAK